MFWRSWKGQIIRAIVIRGRPQTWRQIRDATRLRSESLNIALDELLGMAIVGKRKAGTYSVSRHIYKEYKTFLNAHVLFHDELLSECLGRIKKKLKMRIQTDKPQYVLNVNEEEYCKDLIPKYAYLVPELHKEDITSEIKEEEIKNRPTYETETYLVISIPFVGYSHFLKCQPSNYDQDPPMGIIEESRIILKYKISDFDKNRIEEIYNQDIEKIEKYLQWVKIDLVQHNSWIEENVKKLLTQRKKKLKKDEDLLKSLGLPKRKTSEISQKLISDDEKGLDWDFFVCHASEDKKSIVRELAEKLCKNGYKVWYDEFTLKLGDSLRQKIDYGLAHSRYGIVVLSVNFFEKEWPQKELDGLVAKERKEKKVILPIWHGVTKEDVEKFSPILAGRLAASTSKGLDYVIGEIIKAIE